MNENFTSYRCMTLVKLQSQGLTYDFGHYVLNVKVINERIHDCSGFLSRVKSAVVKRRRCSCSCVYVTESRSAVHLSIRTILASCDCK
jgi:hypothetical protein